MKALINQRHVAASDPGLLNRKLMRGSLCGIKREKVHESESLQIISVLPTELALRRTLFTQKECNNGDVTQTYGACFTAAGHGYN